MTSSAKGSLPTSYDNHPPAEMTVRPLMMLANHEKQRNEFFEFQPDSFIIKLLFCFIAAWLIAFLLYTFFNVKGQEHASIVFGLAATAMPLFSVSLLHHMRVMPSEIARRQIKSQDDLSWVVSRKWMSIKLAWIGAGLSFGLNTWALSAANVFTWVSATFMGVGVCIWAFSGFPIFGFSHLESKSLLYADASSIDHARKDVHTQ